MEEGRKGKHSVSSSLATKEPVTIHKHLSISPGATGFENIYTVKPGKTLTVKVVQVAFPAGTYGELQIAIYYGNLKVWPETDHVSGDNVLFRKEARIKYYSGDPVRVWYNNTNATETRDCFMDLEGVLE